MRIFFYNQIFTLFTIVLLLFISCNIFDTKEDEKDIHPFQNITETTVDSLGNLKIIKEDPDDWQLIFSPELPMSLSTNNKFNPRILPAFPNPASDSIKIIFRLGTREPVSFKIIDKNYKCIKTIIEDTLTAGDYYFFWHLDNDFGNKLPTEIYRCIYSFKSGVIFSGDIVSSRSYQISGHGDIKIK